MTSPPFLPILFGPDTGDPLARLRRYLGTHRCDPAMLRRHHYAPGAIVPRGQPVGLPHEGTTFQTCAFGTLSLPHAGFIGVINVASAIEPLVSLGLRDVRNVAQLRALKADARYSAAVSAMIRDLADIADVSSPVHAYEATLKEPGLPTVTVNGDTGLRTGLHVDSWDRGIAANRALARNRLNINLGVGPRHFLVVHSSLCDVARMCEVDVNNYDKVARMAHDLLAHAPDLEVLCVQVDPGEGYIAPTDNVIHDATTLDATHVDITMSVLGQLAFRQDSQVRICTWSDLKYSAYALALHRQPQA